MNDFFDRLGSAGEEAARQAADVHEKHASARAVRAGAAPAPVKRP
jgi:hypothetical protein